jgi:O-antigen ligase
MGVLLIVARLRIARARDQVDAGTRILGLLTGLFLASTVGMTLLLGALTRVEFVQMLASVVETQEMSSLTGRAAIWGETVKVVEANPLFGYGPSLWDLEFRIKTGMMFTHAHNQYLQTLGAAGIFGLLTLVCYLVVLLGTAWRARVGSKGVTVALALFLLIRGVTEVPLSVSGAIHGEFMVQMFVLVLCVGYLPATERSSSLNLRRRRRELGW